MSEEIVACPGCAKKFRIPEGAPPGSFACTACEADVPYGAPPAKGASKAPARPAPAVARPAAAAAPARPPAPARPAPVAARAAPAASSRRAAPAPSRRAARGHDDEAPKKKDNHGVIWACVGVGGVAVIGLAYFLTKSKDTPKPASPSTAQAPAAKPPAEKPKPAEAPKAEPAAPATAATPAPAEAPKAEPPKPEAAKPEAAKPEAAKPDATAPVAGRKGDFSALGQTFASVDGMSETDRAAADKLVTTAMDLQSGKDGSEAEGKLLQLGKKAIPSILSAFSKQYTSGKWASNEDQYAADKLQDLLHRIAGADGLNPKQEFWPRFMSGAPPEDFEKAANLWVSWWTSKGQFATKYKRATD